MSLSPVTRNCEHLLEFAQPSTLALAGGSVGMRMRTVLEPPKAALPEWWKEDFG
jgi:hypothetical protein